MAFGAHSTTDDVLEGVDLTGKRFLVTGASAGLGVETIRALAAHGATGTGAARDLEKARRALTQAGVANVDLVELDLASLAGARKAADAVLSQGKKFDIIIGNAGIMACPQGETGDGFEMQFGTNHLGHFVFINKLAPLLNRGGRIVMLSSSGHRNSDVNLDDPNFERTPYNAWRAYARSKTANVLYAVALDRRLKDKGVRATAVHPGVIATELNRHVTPELAAELAAIVGVHRQQPKSIPQGAATSVWAAAVAPAELVGAQFCENCGVAEVNDKEAPRIGVRSYALDPKNAEALWAKSEELVGERFAL